MLITGVLYLVRPYVFLIRGFSDTRAPNKPARMRRRDFPFVSVLFFRSCDGDKPTLVQI